MHKPYMVANDPQLEGSDELTNAVEYDYPSEAKEEYLRRKAISKPSPMGLGFSVPLLFKLNEETGTYVMVSDIDELD